MEESEDRADEGRRGTVVSWVFTVYHLFIVSKNNEALLVKQQ